MKTTTITFCLGLLFALNARAADQITKILEANHGKAIGHSVLYDESCQIQVYAPGEFAGNEFYVEYTFENSPAYHVAPYPNNGMVFEWALDEKKGLLTVYISEDKKDYAQFSYNTESLKIRSFRLPGISCDNLK